MRSPSLANRELSVEKRNLLKREPTRVSPRQLLSALHFSADVLVSAPGEEMTTAWWKCPLFFTKG